MSLLGFVAGSNKEEEEEDGLEAGRKKGFALKQVHDHLSGKQGAGDKHAQGTSILFYLFHLLSSSVSVWDIESPKINGPLYLQHFYAQTLVCWWQLTNGPYFVSFSSLHVLV